MSVHQPSSPTYAPGDHQSAMRSSATYAEAAEGFGWVVFAGTMLMIVGILNVIYGIAAIDNSMFFVNGAKYVISDLNTWGWVVLITGAAHILTAFGVWARNTFATWLGIGFACMNVIGILLMIPAYPLLALSIFA